MGHAVALGSGLVGRFVIERLLEAHHTVTVIDLHVPEAFHSHPNVTVLEGDALAHIANLEPNQIVINMLPGRIGDAVRPELLRRRHQIVDLAFTAEDPHRHTKTSPLHMVLCSCGTLALRQGFQTCSSNKPTTNSEPWIWYRLRSEEIPLKVIRLGPTWHPFPHLTSSKNTLDLLESKSMEWLWKFPHLRSDMPSKSKAMA